MHELALAGCTPVPLAAYLKAVGVLRLLAEQADEEAVGWWREGRFHVRSRLDREALRNLFLEHYRPAPIVAPWNGGSGFYPKDNRKGIDPLGNSPAVRFRDLREAIAFGRGLLRDLRLEQKPDAEVKVLLLRRFRAEAPEAALRWFNAAVVLAGEDAAYPPLLGTGGNDGRLDFTNNFMQRLVLLFDPDTGKPRSRTAAWFDNALFGEPVSQLEKGAIGQFHPGAAGGPNATTGFEADSLTNPWDFVLMLEGALAFAASISRRLEAAGGEGLSFPFTVRATAAGMDAGVPEELANARAEIWLPLWRSPAQWRELERLFSEGRVRLGRRTARDGLDFIRALASLGVDRGVVAFQRYAFLMRSGKAYLATPLGQITVRRNPDADLIADLERGGFLDRVRNWPRDENLPASVRQAAWNLEQALFRLAERGGANRVQQALVALGSLARAMAYLTKKDSRDQDVRPALPELNATWLLRADDGNDVFRVAVAIASLGANHSGAPMAVHLLPVGLQPGRWQWLTEDAPDWVWREDGLVRGLVAVVQRRLLRANREESWPAKPFEGDSGGGAAVVARWWRGEMGTHVDRYIEALVRGLVLVEKRGELPHAEDEAVLPVAWWALRAHFTSDGLLRRAGILPSDGRLPMPPRLVPLLRANRIDEAVSVAWQSLCAHSVGLHPLVRPPELPADDGNRLLASLMIPLAKGSLMRGMASLLFERKPMEESA